MTASWHKHWQSRSPRERKVLAAMAVIVALVLYALLVLSAQRARHRLLPAVFELRGQVVGMDRSVSELARLRAMPVTPATATDLRLLVQSGIDSAGLTSSLTRIEAVDAQQVNVVFSAVPFADWLAWVEAMQVQHVRLNGTRIEALSTPGRVNVSATLVRTSP